MGIFALMSSSMLSLSLGSLTLLIEGGRISKAQILAERDLEAIRAIGYRAWNELVYNRSAVVLDSNTNNWVLNGENTFEQTGQFMKTLNFYPVYRNENGEIVSATSTGAYNDSLSKEAVSTVSWLNNKNETKSIESRILLTNWDSKDWKQVTWSGGNGQEIWQEANKYESDDGNLEMLTEGEIKLKEISTSTYATEGILYSSSFNAGKSTVFNSVGWNGTIPETCSACLVKIQIKTASDNNGSPGAWSNTWCGPAGDDGNEDDYFSAKEGELVHLSHNGNQWVKYKLILDGDSQATPVINQIKVNYKD